ncbi:MAG: hypothetical protein IAX21_02720 [Candidatus Bathyarchaeota archaeon]|nr:MAG: hypothetical protein IAX21_02720 [Candidatus Bathyarchaeota archaeon]
MSKAKDKRLVYIPGDLVKEIKEISRRRGESLSLFVSDILKLALKAHNLGYGPKQAAEFLDVMRSQRNLGGVFVPADVLEYLNEAACESETEQLKMKWYESGKWHGKYIKEKFNNPVQTLRNFLEATRWDLSEVEVTNNQNIVKFRCISTLLTGDATELLARFIEGAMHSMGYNTQKSDAMKGMILLDFVK